MLKTVLVALTWTTALGLFHEAQAGDLVAGPENHGLRLRLSVVSASITTPDESGGTGWSVRLDLLNVGKTPVVLVADWPYEDNAGDYGEFLKSAAAFVTCPEVQPEGAQTAGTERKSPQPQQEIKPGASLVVQWQAKGRCLKPEGCFDTANTAPFFPTDGLYGVHAKVVVLTKDKKRVLLTSNEQQVVVGGSLCMPKHATGRIVTADPEKKTVSIDLGTDHKIEKGDTFAIRWGLQASWRLRVTEVGTWYAEGPVETILRDDGPNVPRFPEVNWGATLVPPVQPGGQTP